MRFRLPIFTLLSFKTRATHNSNPSAKALAMLALIAGALAMASAQNRGGFVTTARQTASRGGYNAYSGTRSPSEEIQFRFTLPESKLTSAGVYNAQGNKIRDLWGGRRLAAGTYTEIWDGKDDDGVQQPAGTYSIKLLHHNLWFEYSNLFNSGARPTGQGSLSQYGFPTSVRAYGSNLVWFLGYNEGGYSVVRSTTASPTVFDVHIPALGVSLWTGLEGDVDANFSYMAVQRNRYWGSLPQDTLLVKYSIPGNVRQRFTGLNADAYNLDFAHTSPAGANYGGTAIPCGTNTSTSATYDMAKVAVMKNGRVLAVSQPNANRILFFDKVTGLPARATLTVTKPTSMCWSKNESHLLVVSNGTILQSYRDVGSALLRVAQDDRRAPIIDLASDPMSGVIAAAYSNPLQQVIAYEPTKLRERWRLGKLSGYANTAIVERDRFHFKVPMSGAYNSFDKCGNVSFQSDGKLWVYDQSLYRMQRFTAPSVGNNVDHTMHQARSYSFAADVADPSRMVTNHFCGYRRDWTKPNRPGFGGQGAWVLDRFWGFKYVESGKVPDTGGMSHLWSYNGRLYGAIVQEFTPYKWTFVELTSAGTRECGGSQTSFGLDESLNRYKMIAEGRIGFEPWQGINASGNPVWGAQQVYAQYNANSTVDPIPTDGQDLTLYPRMGNKIITAFYSIDQNLARYHIGALNPDGTWAWRHARPLVESVPFPRNGKTTIYGNLYACRGAYGNDDFAILNWGGEFYNGGQAGKHLIYSKDGLYVDQIGHSMQPANKLGLIDYRPLGSNGNAMFASLMHAGGKYRYLHSTESQSSGVLEWTFENMESYGTTSITTTLGSSVTMDPIFPMGIALQPPGAILDEDNFQRADNNTLGNGWTKLAGLDNLHILGGTLASKVAGNASAKEFDNIAYRGPAELDSSQKIFLPPSFFAPTNYGFTGIGYFTSSFGVVARLQPATKRLLLASVIYVRFSGVTGPAANGDIVIDIAASDGTRRYALGGLPGLFMPPSPGHAYSLRFTVTGTQPTKMEALLWDETDNKEVLREYAECWDPLLEVAGHGGVSIGTQGTRVSRYEKRQFTWPVP